MSISPSVMEQGPKSLSGVPRGRSGPEGDQDAAVSLRSVGYVYPPSRGRRSPVVALRNISFDIRRGDLFCLLGPNGSGKSTLFRILSTMSRQTSGEVRIHGYDLSRYRAGNRRMIGVVFQHPSLDGKLTARENLVHQGHLYGLHGKSLETRIDEVLENAGLSTRSDELVETYSGGMQRRVELAKALLHRPQILILDEPSTGLDPVARRNFTDHLSQLRLQDNVTILLTTHLLDEADAGSRIGIFDEGSLVGIGTPEELKKEIGGDVIVLHSKSPEQLRESISGIFSIAPKTTGNSLRIEMENGHQFIPQLVGAFPGLIDSVYLSKPTLEDVFFHKSGHEFRYGEPSAGGDPDAE